MPESPPPPYRGPAGGWGALVASGAQLLKKGALLRGARALGRMNQQGGFDCPGCAWPEPGHRSPFEFCENGVKAIAAESTSRTAGPAFFATHTVTSLRERPGRWLEDQGRLTHPMRYDGATDTYQPISWDEAFAQIGGALRALSSPDEAIFYTSGRTSNEAAFLYQLFARCFGTNNLPDCANLCHESSGKALARVIGVGKGTVTLEDFERADTIFVWGQNPGTNHPRMLTTLQRAAQRGATIVSVNPLRERGLESFLHPQHVGAMLTGRGTPISTHYVQPLIGGDMAMMVGMLRHVLEAEGERPGEVLDSAFIEEHTQGFSEMSAWILSMAWEDIESQSGLKEAEIREIGDVFLSGERVIVCWAMGLTQHLHAVPMLQTLVNLMLTRGHLGRPGAGLCPVRGHSNVQGDRSMGITPWPKDSFLDALERVVGRAMPRAHGLDTMGTVEAMEAGSVKVFIGLGGNFVAATPDSDRVERLVGGCDLTVQISTKLNRSHLTPGREALILPCLSRSERDTTSGAEQVVSVEDSMSMVHISRGGLSPISAELMSETGIVARLAAASLEDVGVDWAALATSYASIRDMIGEVIPAFADYNARLEAPEGFYLGNSAAERRWLTPEGRALFTVQELPDLSLPEGQLRLMTLRSHDQYNTTIYGDDDRYRGVRGERRVIFMHRDDMEARELRNGQRVNITSVYADGERIAEDFCALVYDIPRGCAASYFPEANVLVSSRSLAAVSRTPTSKWIPVRVEGR